MAPKRHQTTTDHPNLSKLHANRINLQHPALFWRHQLFLVGWCSIRWLLLMTENVTLTMRNPLQEQSEDDVGDYLDWGGHWGRRIDQLLSWANSFDKKTLHSSQPCASRVCQGAKEGLIVKFTWLQKNLLQSWLCNQLDLACILQMTQQQQCR